MKRRTTEYPVELARLLESTTEAFGVLEKVEDEEMQELFDHLPMWQLGMPMKDLAQYLQRYFVYPVLEFDPAAKATDFETPVKVQQAIDEIAMHISMAIALREKKARGGVDLSNHIAEIKQYRSMLLVYLCRVTCLAVVIEAQSEEHVRTNLRLTARLSMWKAMFGYIRLANALSY